MNVKKTMAGIISQVGRSIGRQLPMWAAVLASLFPAIAWGGQISDRDTLETRIGQTVSVADLLAYAREYNPDIQMARQRVKAAKETYKIDTGYPDPQVMVTYYPTPIETRLGPQDWNATLSQAIPYPGKLAEAGEVAKTKAELADISVDKVVRNVTQAIRESYNELYYIQTAKKIVARQEELFDNLIKSTESAYAQDKVDLVAVINAHSHMDALDKDRLLLDSMTQTETANLNRLLGRATDAVFGDVSPPDLKPFSESLEEMYRLAEANQEDIRMANTRVKQSDAELSLARYENLPNFKVGLFYAAIGSPDVPMPPSNAGRDVFGVQFGVSVPLWGEKNSGKIEKARADLAAATADKTANIDDIRAKIRALYYRLEKERGIIKLYEGKLLPQAETAVDATQNWFLEKKSNFSDFVEAQSLWYQFQLALARTRADYGKDLARLARLVGDGR